MYLGLFYLLILLIFFGTALSKYIWYLKDRNVNHTLSWSIKKRAYVYSAGAKYCDLCVTEKNIIMLTDKNCLNRNTPIMSAYTGTV